ncbi:sugar kinase [Aurantimonas sp. VKM B-3413]|uniref:sugar kinase n=1 Tax=Aurantimonas sp. VKM B-3413 TaxID=2779401 RepID=UPI001E39692A|nr:sugar kinase [Aurantimonas sp. VKM B-3413]MCB8839454.1 sugar kinase [Aurantimonas sp. VKM B-3413]
MKKIVTAGEILVEIMATQVGQTFLTPGPLIGPFPSGAPAIFIDQAGRLGQPAGIISSVGADDFGVLNIRRLEASGVDVSAIAVHEGAATGSAFVRYNRDGGRNFVFNIRDSACGLIELDAAARSLLASADHFHVMGSSLFSERVIAVVKAGIDAVKARGGTVSFDPNIRREILSAPGMREALNFVLERADVFLPSGDELFLFTKARSEAEAAAEILARGVRAAVVKKGAAGAVCYDASGAVHSPAFAVEEVDPTGAGDCFGAAFVSFWLRGDETERALRLANACGALAVTKKGPMAGTASLAEAEAFLESRT